MLFSPTARTAVENAIADAERRTSGELVVIVTSAAHRYPATSLTIAALAALTVPLLAVLAGWAPDAMFPDWAVRDVRDRVVHALEGFAAVQALVFVGVLALLHYGRLAQRLTPTGLRRDRVHREALVQFKARGLDATEGRTGVLIYVAEADHIAEVVADTGIYAKVPPEHWGATIRALVDGVKAGRAADGMVAAIALAGGVLAEHFPPGTGNPNELPDHLIEI